MKLNSNQIEALVNTYVNKKNQEIDENYEKELEKLISKNSKKVEDLLKIYNTIPKELKELMYYNREITSENIVSKIIKRPSKKYIDKSDLKNQIIIASIDSKDMEELQKKLSIKF